MGSGVVTAAVVDAGPLIHLYEIDRLPLPNSAHRYISQTLCGQKRSVRDDWLTSISYD